VARLAEPSRRAGQVAAGERPLGKSLPCGIELPLFDIPIIIVAQVRLSLRTPEPIAFMTPLKHRVRFATTGASERTELDAGFIEPIEIVWLGLDLCLTQAEIELADATPKLTSRIASRSKSKIELAK